MRLMSMSLPDSLSGEPIALHANGHGCERSPYAIVEDASQVASEMLAIKVNPIVQFVRIHQQAGITSSSDGPVGGVCGPGRYSCQVGQAGAPVVRSLSS